MQYSKYADLIPKVSGGSFTTSYADGCYVASVGGVANRSDVSVNPSGGVACFRLSGSPGSADAYTGSRLFFEGTSKTVEIVDNF